MLVGFLGSVDGSSVLQLTLLVAWSTRLALLVERRVCSAFISELWEFRPVSNPVQGITAVSIIIISYGMYDLL